MFFHENILVYNFHFNILSILLVEIRFISGIIKPKLFEILIIIS
jgi:hypothetical protein